VKTVQYLSAPVTDVMNTTSLKGCSTVQKIGRAAQADFFGEWVELMNIYVARVLCMT